MFVSVLNIIDHCSVNVQTTGGYPRYSLTHSHYNHTYQDSDSAGEKKSYGYYLALQSSERDCERLKTGSCCSCPIFKSFTCTSHVLKGAP